VTDLCDSDALTLAGMLRRSEVSAREVVAAHIGRVEKLDGAVNAIVTRTFDRALAKAVAADDAMARGQALGLLHGLPVAHKDLADTAGVRTTYGSPLYADHVPDHDTLVVSRMSSAGAISLGKTNTPEFGAGSHTVNPVFGATHNPFDLGRSAGGSSGGAAAALAARMVCLADGSDLGGSLRNPASFCNVVGLRPSPGRVPWWPPADVADTLVVEGPMARTVADVALLLAVLSGPDPRVPLALDAPAPVLAQPAGVAGLLARDMRGLKVAWSADLGLPVEPAVREVLAPARQVLVDLGCEVVDAAPDLSGADEAFRTWRAFRFATLYGALLREHRDQLGPNVTWNTERGLELTTDELSRATVLRATLAERVSEFFATVEVLACPVSQVVPFDVTLDWVHAIDGVPQHTYLDWMASSYLISATGLPAVSVPAGFTADGLPVGLQLVGRWRADWPLLGVAHAFEAATGYARIAPVLPHGSGRPSHASAPTAPPANPANGPDGEHEGRSPVIS
jgi:amidase